MKNSSAEKRLVNRQSRYRDPGAARAWVEANWSQIRDLFESDRVREFVFEPVERAAKAAASSTNLSSTKLFASGSQ